MFAEKRVTSRAKSGNKEDWQSDRMRWTRNPVYPFTGIGGLNPSSSALIDCMQYIVPLRFTYRTLRTEMHKRC